MHEINRKATSKNMMMMMMTMMMMMMMTMMIVVVVMLMVMQRTKHTDAMTMRVVTVMLNHDEYGDADETQHVWAPSLRSSHRR